jgi:V/A-type H+-transporting ATPase subunit I
MKRGLFSPTPMKKVEILALDQHIERLTWSLGGLGVIHLTAAPYTTDTAALQKRDRGEELALCREIATTADRLCSELGVDCAGAAEPARYLPLKEIREKLAAIDAQAKGLLDHRERLEQRVAELKQMLDEVEPFRRVGVPLRQLKQLSFVHFASGQIAERELPGLQNETGSTALVIPLEDGPDARGRRTLVAVASRKGRFALESALEKYHFAPKDLTERYEDVPAEVVQRLRAELDSQTLELGKTNLRLGGLGQRHANDLVGWLDRANNETLVIHAQNHFSRTHNTYLINGWVPEDKIGELQRAVLKGTDSKVAIEVRDPDADGLDEVPTQIRHSPWLQPFALLVSAYGFPGYREIEPTALVAASFLLMFGVMFGDIGQGAVLCAVGLLVARKVKSQGTKDFAWIIAYGGVASMVFGAVYGSLFGIESETLYLIRPMRGTLPFIAATVGLGAVLICLGLLINIINRLRSGDYYNGVLGRTGIVGAIFYTGALGLGVGAFVRGAQFVQTWNVVLLIVVPLAIIFLREPLYALITRRNKLFHEGIFGGLMEAGVEVMETISSYISNTASFARVGAFALSHAGLCGAIFEMVRIVQDLPAGSLLGLAVRVAGNALIVTLEAMVVGIQVIRLEYYEFFTKFFTGKGKAYRPFQIRGWRAKEES